MKRIVSVDDAGKLDLCSPSAQVAMKLFLTVLNAYKNECPDLSIEKVGAIFVIEHSCDLDNYEALGLSRPLTEDRIEYCILYDECVDCCIIINNEYAINLIGKTEYFIQKGLINEENQY